MKRRPFTTHTRSLGAAALLLSAFAFTLPAPAASKALELARQLNQAFVEVAESASQSVVVIQVTYPREPIPLDLEDNSWFDSLPEVFKEQLRPRLEEELERGEDETETPAPRRRLPRIRPQGSGSGVIIREDGYILTNAHVVKDAESIKVRFKDGREFDAEVRGLDELSEVAVIRLTGDHPRQLPVAKFVDSDKVRVGEYAIAIGAPYSLDYTVTVGHVSAKGRANVVPFYLNGQTMDQDFIQTDANINPGNSGGPLVNLDGEVMGINTMIRGVGTGIGFAIPSNLARTVADSLIEKGTYERAWLGIGIGELNRHPNRETLAPGRQDGLVVSEIRANGPAAKSDLKPSDVITAVNGRPVKNTTDLRNEVRSYPLGTTLTLDVVRGGRDLKIKVATGDLPELEVAGWPRNAAPEPEVLPLGITVEAISPALTRKYGLKSSQGVVITEVAEDGPAAAHGLLPGMVISDINHEPVRSLEDYRKLVAAADLKKGVLLNFTDAEGNARFELIKDEE